MAERSHKISEAQREAKRVSQAARRAGDGYSGAEASEAEAGLKEAMAGILASPRHDVLSFLDVAGLSGLLDRVPPERFWPEFRRHYTATDGSIDERRFAQDLAIWPPMASRVAELRAGRE